MNTFFPHLKTAQELGREGVSANALARLCRTRAMIKICRNIYTPADTWNTWNRHQQRTAQHLAFIKTHPGYVLSHDSAALWWGAPLLKLPRAIRVSHPSAEVRSRPGVLVSSGRVGECAEAELHQGVWVTSARQTALDCARSLPVLEALCVVDYFLHQGMMGAGDFAEAVAASSGRGVRGAREVVRLMSGKAESIAETIARYRILSWGFTPPQEQVEVWVDGYLYRPDFLWEGFRVILEVDGMVKYTGSDRDTAHEIKQERYRQRRLEKLGYRVVRVHWDDLVKTPENLRDVLLRAGVR